METRVRLHRKNLKQAEFLKRQAEKERREVVKEEEPDRSDSKVSSQHTREKSQSPPPSPSPEENSDSDNNMEKVNFEMFFGIKLIYVKRFL